MHESLRLLLAWVAGVGLGAVFFMGLWWTVRRSLTAAHPALWILGSLLVRTAVLLAGFYWVAGGQWQRLLACGLGFVMARLFAIRLTSPALAANHAP